MLIDRPTLAKLAVVALLVFAQGIPASFIQNALPIIYRTLGLDLDQLWLFSLPLTPRWIKWMIAPVVDRVSLLPIGRRKSWILVGTVLGSLGYAALVWPSPTLPNLKIIIAILFFAELIMAIQDIAVDGYCVEALASEKPALAGATIAIAQTGSFFVASAVIMVMYEYYGWRPAIVATASLLLLCTLPVLFFPEPISAEARQRTIERFGRPSLRGVLSRPNAIYLMALVAITSLYSSFSYNVFSVMLVDKGMTVGQIGIASGTAITAGMILGIPFSAWLMLRFTLKKVIVISAVLTVIAHMIEVSVAASTTVTMSFAVLTFFFAEIAVTPYFTLMSAVRMRWTSKREAGTEFTLQSSIRSGAIFVASAASGPTAAAMGWTSFYVLAIFLSLGATLAIYLLHDRLEAAREREDAIMASDARAG